ncbi:hypothetical protein BC829DRAFT_280959 [Chytridium lagenaria]|nr:hypothetical protein BC829DRAFT_280959 [Chytridium lagenaria]
MSNTWTTPGYGFIAGYGGENVAPGISDDRCISTIRDGVGCVSDNYASAMEICNSNPDCGGFICWDQTSADAVKNCYPLLTPMRLGVISSATQNAYVKQGAFVVINNARSVPFPISDSSLPSPPPPLPPPPAAVPVAPSESPISNAFSQSLQPSQNDDVRSTTTTEPVPIESTTSAGWSSSMSLAQVTTALLAAPNNIPVNSSTIATVELNGSPIQTPESASRTNSSSDSNTIIAVGVGSFAALWE